MYPKRKSLSRVSLLATSLALIWTVTAASPSAAKLPPVEPSGTNAGIAVAGVAGLQKISTQTAVAPGATRSSWWNNTPPTWPQGRVHFVDAWPVATTVTQPCAFEVVRWWKVQNWNADNTRELEVHWIIKNVGAYTCDADVYFGWIGEA